MIERTAAGALIALGLAGAANAQTDVPAGLHNASETWTLAGSPYRLKGQVYFTNNSTLTIEAGVVVASLVADQGSLAITRGSQIFVQGTADQPVIFTSDTDVATWTGTTGAGSAQIPGDPKTGTWQFLNNQWGNLTIMGNAYISENAIGANTPAPNPANVANMEGLVNGASTDQYGGGNDDDDSGMISYASFRYGGKVVNLNNELNGLSLGGIGRGTDIHHVEVINNKDDGIEIWGGAVNLKYVVVYNVGDDSVDVDQGYRGKMQYGLIVLGASSNNSTGSGLGDGCLEMDGAEQSDYQPVTTTTLYNFTLIGQPGQPRGLFKYRDGARVQLRNSILMDAGSEVLRNDNVDGDGGLGYGHNGTLTFNATWTTPYNAVPPHANDPVALPGFYAAQATGNLNEVSDCVFYGNAAANAYTTLNAVSALVGDNNVDNVLATSLPIVSITRAAPVLVSGVPIARVIGLDPRAANDAVDAVNVAPNDGFFRADDYRGAFGANGQNWLCSWTSLFAYGISTACNEAGTPFCFGDGSLATACPCGNVGQPGRGCDNSIATGGAQLSGTGSPAADTVVLTSSGELATANSILLSGPAYSVSGLVFGDGIRCVAGSLKRLFVKGAVGGAVSFPGPGDPSLIQRAAELGDFILPGDNRYYQVYYRDPNLAFCPNPPGNSWNVSNGYHIGW